MTIKDYFESKQPGLDSPAFRHFAISPSNDNDLTIKPRALYVTVEGNLEMKDDKGTILIYPVTAGQILPFRPVRVLSGTTATVIGWY